MDLWATLGISPEIGLLGAVAGIVAAILVGGTLAYRRARTEEHGLDIAEIEGRR